MAIGSVDRDADWHSSGVGQHRAIDAQLASIGRVVPRFFPRPAGLSSSLRPSTATTNRSPLANRIAAIQPPRIVGTPRHVPHIETIDALCVRSPTTAVGPSTGIPYAAHTRSPPASFAHRPEVAHCACAPVRAWAAAMAQWLPKARPACARCPMDAMWRGPDARMVAIPRPVAHTTHQGQRFDFPVGL